MSLLFLLKGILLGFSIAAPVGPIGVLCIRRTLAEGRAVGFVSGLGAATADAAYGAVAGFELTFITSLLVGEQFWMRLIGGAFLLYLGVRTFWTKQAEAATAPQERNLWRAYTSTLFLTLTNPTTILSFAAVFAGLGLVTGAGDYTSAGLLVGGVFLGSALWWLALSGGVSLLRAKFDARAMGWVNHVSGVVIAGFGVVALGSLLF